MRGHGECIISKTMLVVLLMKALGKNKVVRENLLGQAELLTHTDGNCISETQIFLHQWDKRKTIEKNCAIRMNHTNLTNHIGYIDNENFGRSIADQFG